MKGKLNMETAIAAILILIFAQSVLPSLFNQLGGGTSGTIIIIALIAGLFGVIKFTINR